MPISTTTFEERLTRMGQNIGQPELATAAPAPATGASARAPIFTTPLSARLMSVPFLTGLAILIGGTAYALTGQPPELDWMRTTLR